jgi:hypothetical protein
MIEKHVVDFIRKMRFSSEKKHDLKSYLNAAADKFGLKYNRVHAIWHSHDLAIESARTEFQEKLALEYIQSRFEETPKRLKKILKFIDKNFDIEPGRARAKFGSVT